jgi:hypothetical protein
MREENAAGRVREPLEPVPPALVRPRQLDLGVERIGHAVEQSLLVADMPVEGHRRHTEAVGYLANADGSETALVAERDRGLHDSLTVKP